MRRAARTDANHAAIRDALRKAGASVVDTSSVGGGFPDLVVGFVLCRPWAVMRVNYLVEVKDGTRRPSERELTPAQREFSASWRGQWVKGESVDEALALLEG